MPGYIARRLTFAVLTIWAISLVCFLIIQAPGTDYVDVYIGRLLQNEQIYITLEEAEALRVYHGLDKPVYVQYLKWIWNMVRADFGYSFEQMFPIKDLIAERVLYTIALTGMTVLVTWTMAIPMGIFSALRQHSVADYTVTMLGFIGLAVPDFLLGLVLMYVTFKYFHVSVGGLFSPEYITGPLPDQAQWMGWSLQRLWNMITHLWIPAVVLGTSGTAGLIRIMRNNLLDELYKNYVTTARSKGLASWRVIAKYPVRVAINPLISSIGYLLPTLVGGSVIVSIVLGLPTLGPLLLRALLDHDIYLSSTIILLLGILTVIGTMISDILLVIVDPRISMHKTAE